MSTHANFTYQTRLYFFAVFIYMAAVFCSFDKTPPMDEMKAAWASFKGRPQELKLPSAPEQFLRYFEEPDRPQTRLDRMNEHGMAD